MDDRVLFQQDAWGFVVYLHCWAFQKCSNACSEVLDFVGLGSDVVEYFAVLAAVPVGTTCFWLGQCFGRAFNQVLVRFDNKVVDLGAALIKFILAEENLTILSSAAIIFEARWQNWSKRVQNKFCVFLVTLDPKLERKAAVMAGGDNVLEVLHAIEFNHGRVLAAGDCRVGCRLRRWRNFDRLIG